MGIYIPGMKMPKDGCKSCAFNIAGICLIRANMDKPYEVTHSCPLIEIQPNGRLIDADAFLARNEYFADREFVNPKYDDTLKDLIDRADTIIPAEPEKEDESWN